MSKQSVALGQAKEHFPDVLAQFETIKVLDSWIKGDQQSIEDANHGREYPAMARSGRAYQPDTTTNGEYDDLEGRSPGSWASLIVRTLAQTAFLDGVRVPGAEDNVAAWKSWERNRMGSKQIPLYRDAIGHGLAFTVTLPGIDRRTGKKLSRIIPTSAGRMCAWYDEDDDEYPLFAIWAEKVQDEKGNWGYDVKLYDDEFVHQMYCKNRGTELKEWLYIEGRRHTFKIPPIVRYGLDFDLKGNGTGVIEPIIPLLRRVDQDTFDRLVVQRFGAWKIRYATGLAKPKSAAEEKFQALMMRQEDLLISSDPTSKFGTLDSTDIAQFISANSADLRELSAVTQTPPHHLLGLSDNLQAEALAAAEAGLQRKSIDFRTVNGESHEQTFRLVSFLEDDGAVAEAYDMQVRWRDTESRSLVQATQALRNLAEGLKVPVEMLWEKIPGWSDVDSARALQLIEDGGVEALLAQAASELEVEQAKQTAEGDAAAAARSNDPAATPTDPGSAARGGGPNSKGNQPKKS